MGCTARLVAVVEEFPDGRSNIVVRGEAPFRVDELLPPDDPVAEALAARVDVPGRRPLGARRGRGRPGRGDCS